MRKTLAAVFAALLVGIGLVWTQPPAGAWLVQAPASAPPYTGPGDLGISFSAFWSLRCYSTSYTGNVVDVWDAATGSTTETLITCSAGGVLNTGSPTALATTCAAGCRIKIWYDQTVGTFCSGSACDQTQATNSKRSTYTQSCHGSLPCGTFGGAQCYGTGGSVSTSVPFSATMMANRTAAFTSYLVYFAGGGSDAENPVFQDVNSANNSDFYIAATGSSIGFTMPDSQLNAVQLTDQGSSSNASTVNVNGSSSAWTAKAGDVLNQPFTMGDSDSTCSNIPWQGQIVEMGVVNSLFSSGNMTSLHTNQSAYWGTP